MMTKAVVLALSVLPLLTVSSSPASASLTVSASTSASSPVAESAIVVARPPLYGTRWVVESTVDGDTVTRVYPQGSPDAPFLVISASGSVSGNDSCNSFGGDAVVEGDRLRVGSLMSTMRYCDGAGSVERLIHTVLQSDPHFRLSGDLLYLTAEDGSGLVLRATSILMVAPGR